MKRQLLNSIAVGAALVAASLVTVSCMKNPSTPNKGGAGSLEIWASVTKPQAQSVLGKTTQVLATTWDSLVVRITANDMDTVLSVTKFGPQDPYVTVTLDLSMAVGITSSAIGKLVSAYRQLRAQNRSIRIHGCSETLYSTFQKIKLDTLIQITR